MSWFTKKRDVEIKPQRTRESMEAELLRCLRAIPAERWRDTLDGIATVADNGACVEMQYFRMGEADGNAEAQCDLYVDGRRIPIEGYKIEPLYRQLAKGMTTH